MYHVLRFYIAGKRKSNNTEWYPIERTLETSLDETYDPLESTYFFHLA